ncbi:hypothetical protein [Paenibacillus sp. 2KB_22]|uniref:hypothetical protein n=1 Tax=Paenibacillus sp. 2KB_22 TaxID=3232978 RepID=UPI003F9D4BCF
MYKVLLVDDEFMISDGISSVVNWSRLGTELTGIAQDGLEALAMTGGEEFPSAGKRNFKWEVIRMD